MVTLAKEEGINAFKFFLAYKGALAIPEDDMLHALRKCKELGALPMVRRLAAAPLLATPLADLASQYFKCGLHVNKSCAGCTIIHHLAKIIGLPPVPCSGCLASHSLFPGMVPEHARPHRLLLGMAF